MMEWNIFTLLLLLLANVKCNIKWMALDHHPKDVPYKPTSVCSKKYGLTQKQIRYCKNNFQWMPVVKDAASAVVSECQHQLVSRRWNCYGILKAPHYDEYLKKETKQAAFVYALSAASLALNIANGCMAGKVSDCFCRWKSGSRSTRTANPQLVGMHQEGSRVHFPSRIIEKNGLKYINEILGCKGILDVGIHFAKYFSNLGYPLKWRNKKHQIETAVNKHNVEVGLNELRSKEQIVCKCTGFTAGCTHQFCHRRIVTFQKVATRLLGKYDSAKKLNVTSYGSPTGQQGKYDSPKKSNTSSYTASISSKIEQSKNTFSIKKVDNGTLIYIAKRIDQCKYSKGIHSVSRRICVLDRKAANSCHKLCCRRGYRERVIEVDSECNCRFVYCCKVVCDICKSFKVVHECV